MVLYQEVPMNGLVVQALLNSKHSLGIFDKFGTPSICQKILVQIPGGIFKFQHSNLSVTLGFKFPVHTWKYLTFSIFSCKTISTVGYVAQIYHLTAALEVLNQPLKYWFPKSAVSF